MFPLPIRYHPIQASAASRLNRFRILEKAHTGTAHAADTASDGISSEGVFGTSQPATTGNARYAANSNRWGPEIRPFRATRYRDARRVRSCRISPDAWFQASLKSWTSLLRPFAARLNSPRYARLAAPAPPTSMARNTMSRRFGCDFLSG